jgi:hypothetical protein
MSFIVGDKVHFGRKNGQQSLGEVVKVNRKSLKVKLLEPRGMYKAHKVGGIWRCHPSMCTPVGQDTTPTPTRSEEDLMRAIDICFCGLSPENLTCDGELSRTESNRRYRKLMGQLKAAFVELGRTVTEDEAYKYCKRLGR